jgi:ATP-dependent Lhr-like helicase
VFTDSRRRVERIAFLINQRAGSTVAFAHHGSLSREVRQAVEHRLVSGDLPCVVATGSLELGIDIGWVDEVILAGSPAEAAMALQRVGRSGHGVGMVSRAQIMPFNGMDLVLAAALEGAIQEREIEATKTIENPLDILAQIILALCLEKKRHIDELYQILRGFFPFRTLPRSAYDGVVRMLTGYYAETRVRELRNRLYLDGETGELSADDGVLSLLYSSGGVIANRGYYSLRLQDGVKIGELDEEFVWERRVGDSFHFGTRSWRITTIGSESVEVAPLDRPADFTPFWKAEAMFRSPVLVRRVLELFDRFERSPKSIAEIDGLSPDAREALLDFIRNQRETQGSAPLPGMNHIPIEIIDD